MPEQFKILVEIAMKDGISSALHVIQRRLMGINDTIDLTTNKFSKMQVAVLGGMAALGGFAALDGFAKLAQAGGKILDQQQLMLSNGTSLADLNKEMATAANMTGIGGSNLYGNLNMVSDLRQLLGGSNLSEVLALAPTMMKAGIAAGLMEKQDPEAEAYKIAQIQENLGYDVNRQTGQMDPSRVAASANLFDAVLAATNGRVTLDQLLSFSKQARTAGRLLTDQGLIDMVPVIQAMGGYRAGTGVQAFDRAGVGGVMTTRGTSWLERLGLLSPDNVHKGESGYARLDPGAIKGSAMMAQDPQAWANTYLMPALKAAGMSTADAMKTLAPGLAASAGNGAVAMLTTILQSGLSNTTNGLLAELIGNAVMNAKDVANIGQAQGTDQYTTEMGSLGGATLAFTGALDSLWEALGLPAAQMAVPILTNLSGGIREFSQIVLAHQSAVKVVEGILLGVGYSLVTLGSIAVVTALLGMVGVGGTLAGVAAGIMGLAAALIALEAVAPNLFANHAGEAGGPRSSRQAILAPLPPLPLPPPAAPPGNVYLDGKKVGAVLAHHLSSPRTGPTNGNLRNVGSGSAATGLGGLY